MKKKSILVVSMIGLLAIIGSAATNSRLYTIKEAGLQFEIPEGWKVEVSDKNGVTQHNLTSNDRAVALFFVVAQDTKQAENLWQAYREGIDKKMDNVKTDGPKEGNFNGLDHLTESGTGESGGQTLHWRLGILMADKPVLIFGALESNAAEKHSTNLEKFMTSIKRIDR